MQPQKIKFKHRLLTKLQLSHLIVVVLPMALVSWFLVNTAQNSIEKTIQNRNLEFARRAAHLITTTLNYAQAIVRITAQNPLIYESNRISQELTINNLVKRFQIFKKVCLIDSSGTVLLSTSYREENSDYSKSAFFAKIAAGQSYYSEVYQPENKHPVMDIAEPIRFRNAVIGALFVTVDLSEIWDLVENSKIGEKGQAFIIDRNGLYLAHSERIKVYLKERFNQQDILSDIRRGISDHKVYRNSDGNEMLSSYTPLAIKEDSTLESNPPKDASSSRFVLEDIPAKTTSNSFPHISLEDLGLGVIIQQPTSEAFAPARNMRYQMIVFTLVSITLALILASINTQRILSPISKLIAGIERFSTGNLDYKIKLVGRDEISMLANRFNEMAIRLLEYQNKLKRTERLEMMHKMSSILSHEIRNPLNSMVINMQIMRREFQKEECDRVKLEKYHQIVASEIRRVDELVNNFLLVARPHKLKKEKYAIDRLLNEVIMQQQAAALHQGIRVERHFEVTNLHLQIDTARIRQALLNIYLNGIQAMRGGGRFIIKLAVRNNVASLLQSDANQIAQIQFIDTGNGIPSDVLQHIFDFYFSTKENGTGLGLSIAQQIIEEHSGRLFAESLMNKGSTFTIYLPV
ncbi:HAMP domain-containing protein [candidate division KSB1 bacterium]|nr:HAMP domain-containing protein [candidate division KSB1 bacterium]